MDHNALLAGIDVPAALDLLSRMVQHKSYSKSDGEKQLAAFMAGRMREIGLETELAAFGSEGRVNAVGCWKGSGGGKSLMFNGHLDTNPVTEGWTVDPWAGKVDDAFIYGIGVSNMKAGDAAYFCAVKTLIDAGVKLRGDVILTYVVGELQGGVGTYSLVEQGLRARIQYNLGFQPRHELTDKIHDAAVIFGRIDHHLFGVRREKITNRSGDEIQILVDQRRGGCFLRLLLQASPKYPQKAQIPLNLAFTSSLRGRS